MHAYIHTYTHAYTHTYMHTHAYTYICSHSYIHSYIHTHVLLITPKKEEDSLLSLFPAEYHILISYVERRLNQDLLCSALLSLSLSPHPPEDRIMVFSLSAPLPFLHFS